MVSPSPEARCMVQVVTLELRYLREDKIKYLFEVFLINISEMKPALQSESLSLPTSDLPTTTRSGCSPGQLVQYFLLHRDQILIFLNFTILQMELD